MACSTSLNHSSAPPSNKSEPSTVLSKATTSPCSEIMPMDFTSEDAL
eukprot:CAMPEP_0204000510 /NCGR_PEP_ID=MMETSP0360-20130528/15424_1 /ASSEMBLY_ACC=CAM_ASM_000342 /TAXON_ID=268821 /ORGANISM="Scrippsiella Hangoei, Strain SHTV-5" /LENGTH=46 /DNA_ID= /DNA_START= /DNA_END= /DNA_ORIENTATION=